VFAENDPAKVSEMENKLGFMKDTANRWIDNLVTTLHHIKQNMQLDSAALKTFCKEVNVPEEPESFP